MKILKRTVAYIHLLRKNRKNQKQEKKRLERQAEINVAFRVTERDGRLYILCNEIAVYRALPTETTESVITKMTEMKESSYYYRNLNK